MSLTIAAIMLCGFHSCTLLDLYPQLSVSSRYGGLNMVHPVMQASTVMKPVTKAGLHEPISDTYSAGVLGGKAGLVRA